MPHLSATHLNLLQTDLRPLQKPDTVPDSQPSYSFTQQQHCHAQSFLFIEALSSF